jgi:aminoglycoside phosphotransferase (APT) family kinase protein
MSETTPAPETTHVREAHRFDEKALTEYLAEQLPGFHGPIEVRQFEGGQSNPTFIVDSAEKRYVLRKKPPGQLLPSAHQVEREYRIMKALKGTDVAVPEVHLLCLDTAVIGTSFFVMDYLPGRIFRDPRLPGIEPGQRKSIYDAMNDMLARLHKVNWQELGLADFGKKESFIGRQITRWSKQYEAAKIDTIEAMDELMVWLPKNIPGGDESGEETTIVHGDYRLENIVFHPNKSEVLGVLDWELSTLGNPLADLGYNCALYHLPAYIGGLPGLAGTDLHELGLPTEDEYVHSYCHRTGRDTMPNHKYFVIFSLFRLAAIAQGVMSRAKQGIASSAQAERVGAMAKLLADTAWGLASQSQSE